MADTKIVVPIGLNESPQPAQQQEKPAWAKRSLHNVHMPKREVELAPSWEPNPYGGKTELKFREVEPRAEPEATQPYQQQGANRMEQNQFDNQQQQGSAQAPDIEDYDLYDELDVVRYRHDSTTFIQSQIDARVQAALAPHEQVLKEGKVRSDFAALHARYGNDENFEQVMEAAAGLIIESGDKMGLIEAFQRANDASAAKPGRRGSAHLPEELRRHKKVTDLQLGKIMAHNHQTGRAKFGKRGW